ncbi:MAG: response regulator [bacterium]
MTKIMIVDDEMIIAIGLGKRLQQMGFTISSVASSAKEAIKQAERDKPDIVLMDINMCGELDGIEAAKQIKSTSNALIAFLTGYPDKKMMEEAKIVDPIGYFVKPVECEELQRVFNSAMLSHKKRKPLLFPQQNNH